MKSNQIFVPPSVRASAERSLLSKAYEVYRFSADDERKDSPSPILTTPQDSVPLFQPGTKVCLTYNKHVELYVVLAAAQGPGSSATGTPDIARIIKEVGASSEPSLSSETPTAAGGEPTTNKEAQTSADKNDNADTKNKLPTTSHRLNFLYVLFPLVSNTSKLKPNIDLTLTKVIAEHHLVLPPAYSEGRIIHIPVAHRGKEVLLPVEIKKVERGLGLIVPASSDDVVRQMIRMNIKAADVVAGPNPKCNGPEEDVWKYKFLHSAVWLSEDAVLELVEGHLGGVWDTMSDV